MQVYDLKQFWQVSRVPFAADVPITELILTEEQQHLLERMFFFAQTLGGFIFLKGPQGSGKTTLLHLLDTLLLQEGYHPIPLTMMDAVRDRSWIFTALAQKFKLKNSDSRHVLEAVQDRLRGISHVVFTVDHGDYLGRSEGYEGFKEFMSLFQRIGVRATVVTALRGNVPESVRKGASFEAIEMPSEESLAKLVRRELERCHLSKTKFPYHINPDESHSVIPIILECADYRIDRIAEVIHRVLYEGHKSQVRVIDSKFIASLFSKSLGRTKGSGKGSRKAKAPPLKLDEVLSTSKRK